MSTSTSDSELVRLKEELKSALERKGVISSLKSRIRSEIYHCLEANVPSDPHLATVDAEMPEENVMINELIREYLAFNGYTNTLSVFLPEARVSRQPILERVFLQSELGLRVEDPQASRTSLPLLYGAVSKLRRSKAALSGIHPTSSSSSTATKSIGLKSTDEMRASSASQFSYPGSSDGAKTGYGASQKLDELDKPSPISFKNI
eukprot:INCI1138.1.p1 GENE.INCI1138.1~~INCI1138.1.p1  ORF type:complete len:205 (-),score=31.47 INCI1138.1:33-647(-)